MRPAPEIDVIRRSDRTDPLDNRRLRRAVEDGSWVRVAPGAFVRTHEWSTLTAIDRHRLLVEEVSRRMRPGAVFALHSAAAVWGIDVLGAWPDRVQVFRPPASGGRSTGWVVRHTRSTESLQTAPWGIHRVTSPAQTALDLARHLTFDQGVAAVDQALWNARRGGPLTSVEDVAERWDQDAGHRGDVRAMRVIEFASPLAANVRESQSRVLIARLGFPAPRLQERRVLRTGRLVYGDFYFPQHDHWAEFDGNGKYLSPEFGADRDPAQIVLDEKNRENEIRREVRGFSRWEPADLKPRRLYDILTGDGLPSSRSRP